MKTREEVKNLFCAAAADAFMKDKSFFEEHPETRFREDLAANSMMYFPLLGMLEEELDIEIGLSDFQTNCHTVQQGIDYVTNLYETANC